MNCITKKKLLYFPEYTVWPYITSYNEKKHILKIIMFIPN